MLGIIAATECGVGIWALVRSEKIETLPESDMLKALSSLSDPEAEEAWDNIIRRVYFKLNFAYFLKKNFYLYFIFTVKVLWSKRKERL